MKLIPNARNWWRMFSVQAQLIAMAVLGAWGAMPDDLKARLPDMLAIYTAAGVLVLGVFGRLVQQPKLHEDDKAPQ